MASLTDLTPGTWTIDESHTTVGFTARHLMITKVRGRFGKVSGAAVIAENPLDSTVSAEIELGSIDTGDAGHRSHGRGQLLGDRPRRLAEAASELEGHGRAEIAESAIGRRFDCDGHAGLLAETVLIGENRAHTRLECFVERQDHSCRSLTRP